MISNKNHPSFSQVYQLNVQGQPNHGVYSQQAQFITSTRKPNTLKQLMIYPVDRYQNWNFDEYPSSDVFVILGFFLHMGFC